MLIFLAKKAGRPEGKDRGTIEKIVSVPIIPFTWGTIFHPSLSSSDGRQDAAFIFTDSRYLPIQSDKIRQFIEKKTGRKVPAMVSN